MKSQRSHHKPVNNELAQWLGEHIEQWKPHFPVIGIIAGVLLVGGIVYLIAFSGEDMSSAPSWQAYYAAYGEPKVEDALKTVAEKQKGTLAGRWAMLALGDQQLRQATQQLVQNPKLAKDNLKLAEATLQEAAEGASDRELLARVHTSLAKVSESGNKLDEARKYYGLVLNADPEGTFGKAAAKALKRLEKGSDVPELLAWLDKQDLATRPKATGNPFDMGTRREPLPERPDLSIPGEMKLDGPSPLGPSSGRSPLGPDPLGPALPESPLDLKGLPKLDLPKTNVPKTETPKTATPTTEKSTTEKSKTKSPAVPSPVKPAVPKPVKPAEEEKPAEEKKAEAKSDDKPEEKPEEK